MNIEGLKQTLYYVVGILHDVRNELGPGLSEYVYQEGLEIELKAQHVFYEREKEYHPTYRGIPMSSTFRLDFVCLKNIIIECKAVTKLNTEHREQLFNYMRLTKLRMGILVSFSPTYMELERYLYDPETDEILTYNGEKFNSNN